MVEKINGSLVQKQIATPTSKLDERYQQLLKKMVAGARIGGLVSENAIVNSYADAEGIAKRQQEQQVIATPTTNTPATMIEAPTVEETGEASGSEEAGDIITAQTNAAKQMSPTEIRGGILDPIESAKRTSGFLNAVFNPFSDEDTQSLFAQQEISQKEGARKPNESKEAYFERIRSKGNIVAKEYDEFKRVANDPKSSLSDMLFASPIGKKIKAQQQSTLETYGDRPWGEDAINLLKIIPQIVSAPLGEFEVKKGESSFDVGAEAGAQLTPTIITSTALMAPEFMGGDLANQFNVAPLSTAFQYVPLLGAVGPAIKAISKTSIAGKAGKIMGAAKVAQYLGEASVLEKVGAGWRALLATPLEVVAKKVGTTTQVVMDGFYNKDPAITALMEEAFAEGQGTAHAIDKLGDVWIKAITASKTIKQVGDDTFVMTPKHATTIANKENALYDMSSVLFDATRTPESAAKLGVRAGTTSIPKYASFADAQARISEVFNAKALKTVKLVKDEIPKVLKNEVGLDNKQIISTMKYIDEVINTSNPRNISNIIDALPPTTPTFVKDALTKLNSIRPNVVHEIVVDKFIKNPKSLAAPLRDVAEDIKKEIIDHKMNVALENEATMYGVTPTFETVIEGMKGTSSKPNVLNISPDNMKALIETARMNNESALVRHLESMKELTGQGKYVSEPIAWFQAQEAATKAFQQGSHPLTRKVNQFIKNNALPLNPASIISNVLGNVFGLSAKFGTDPFMQVGQIVNSGWNFRKYLKNPMLVDNKITRPMGAAIRSGIFDVDRITADTALYAIADPVSKIGKLVDIPFGGAVKVGGKLMKVGDEAPKVFIFERAFNTIDSYVSKLKPGESVGFPLGPNVRGSITLLDNDVIKFSKRVNGQAKPFKTTTINKFEVDNAGKNVATFSSRYDDVIGAAAKGAANGMIFDYSRVPGVIAASRRTPLIGAGSPFFTYQWIAADIPGVKKGIASTIMSANDGITSTSSTVNAMLASNAINVSARRALQMGIGKTMQDDPDSQRLHSFDPTQPTVATIVGPTTSDQTMIHGYSSANWLQGMTTVLSLIDGVFDSNSDIDQYSKQIIKNGDASEKEYFAARRQMEKNVNRPEFLPALANFFGAGGSMALDTFTKIIDGEKTGVVAPRLADVGFQMLVPGYLRRPLETIGVYDPQLAMNSILPEKGIGRIANSDVREGAVESGFIPAASYFLATVLGLDGLPVNNTAQADKLEKMYRKEMAGRFNIWGKERRWKLMRKLGNEAGAQQLEIENEIMKGLIDSTIMDWRGRLEQKGLITKIEEPVVEEPVETTE